MDFFFKESFRCSTTNIRGKILIQKKNVIFKKKKKRENPKQKKTLTWPCMGSQGPESLPPLMSHIPLL